MCVGVCIHTLDFLLFLYVQVSLNPAYQVKEVEFTLKQV